jgi:hypothetical protein
MRLAHREVRALVAVPPGVVAVILPVVAPVGTVAVICVAEFTVNVVALMLLKNFTELVVKLAPLTVPLKFVPVIVTDVPTGPKAGVNEVIVGVGAVTTVKLVALVLCPATVYTWIGPVVAPAGTTAVTEVALVVVGVTRLEVLKRTWVGAVVKVPLIVTVEPTKPAAGEKVGTPGQGRRSGRVVKARSYYRWFSTTTLFGRANHRHPCWVSIDRKARP